MLNGISKFSFKKTFFASLCLGLVGLSPVQAMDLGSVSQVYFFGDSLTDSGFNDQWTTTAAPPGIPVLPSGKAPTNTSFGGHTWAQYIAHDLKGLNFPVYPGPSVPDQMTNNTVRVVPGFVSGTLNGTNYAASGSTTDRAGFRTPWAPSLIEQVNQYLKSVPQAQTLDPNAIYFIWSGANDILTGLSAPVHSQPVMFALIDHASNVVVNQVKALVGRGAKRVVVFSLPNMGITPFASSLGDPTLPASLKSLTFTFNSMLNAKLGQVIDQTQANILYVDTFHLLEQVANTVDTHTPYLVNGKSFTFTNYKASSCSLAPSAIYCYNGAPGGYIFADGLHPTDLAHQVIAQQVEKLLTSWQ